MKRFWFLGGIMVALAVTAVAEPRGVAQAEIRQGQLYRLFSSWKPGAQTEGRWWWSPDRGGSGWVRAGGLQVGPLTCLASGPEGTKSWGPGTGSTSGRLGVALEADFAGLWAVQGPGSFEAGLQGVGRWGAATLAVGTDRTWSFAGPDGWGSLWVDRIRAGGSWKGPFWGAGAEVSAEKGDLGPVQQAVQGRLSWDGSPWEACLKSSWSSSLPWNWVGTVGWRSGGWTALAGWDRSQGGTALVATKVPAFGLVWGARSEGFTDGTLWTARGGISLEGRGGRGRWSGAWSLAFGRSPLVQRFSASWKEGSFEAEGAWRVEGLSLGWMGTGSRFDLTWRWLF